MSKKNKKLTKEEEIELAKNQLWELGNLQWKLKPEQLDIYNHFKNSERDIDACLISRQYGKCIAEGTLIPTTKGMKPIEDIQIGDYVYGYNKEGNIEPTKVEQVHDQGIQEVYDLVHSRKIYATVTNSHQFLTYNPQTQKDTVKTVGEMYGHEKIRREFIQTECGNMDEPQAYAIGALLGDGCSRQGVNAIHISSDDEEIVLKTKKQLNAKYHYKQSKKNYTWVITDTPKHKKAESRPVCGFYEEWCSGRYAHEKIIDLNIIKKWNRSSCLDLLAGIIDTDGTVAVVNNILKISITSQSKSIIDACKFLFNQLFFVDCNIHFDDRDKYVNGGVYILYVNNNLHSPRILKELDQYLQVSRKKWKYSYSFLLANNSNEKFIGVKKENKRKLQCYDIGINNGTHLYLMQNGLITHNSYTLCAIAIEVCLQKPNAIVKYACPQQKMVKRIIYPRVREIIEDCPEHLKPEWKEQEKIWLFPNGSEIQVAGCNAGQYDNLRGGSSDLCIVDEAAFVDELDTVIFSVLSPTTDTTGGKILLASTPNPDIPNHEFHENFVFPMEATGQILIKTYETSPFLNDIKRERIISRYPGGEKNPKFQAEYLCVIPKVSENTICPEFTLLKDQLIVDDIEVPPHRDFYNSMDVGFKDLTIVLFGFYNFKEACFYVMDELVMNGPEMTTQNLAKEIKIKESTNFFDSEFEEEIEPYLRIMDNDLKLINDLHQLHGLMYIATDKDNKEAAVNNLRIWVQNKRIKIHKKCKHLIYHLEFGQWENNRKKFKHLPDSTDKSVRGGHVDAVDSLIYLLRNVEENHNPYPDDWNELRGPNIFNKRKKSTKMEEIMHTIMNIKR